MVALLTITPLVLTLSTFSVGQEFDNTVPEVLDEFGDQVVKTLPYDIRVAQIGNLEFPFKIVGKKGSPFENFLFIYNEHAKVRGLQVTNIEYMAYVMVGYFDGHIWDILDYVGVPPVSQNGDEDFTVFPFEDAILDIFKTSKEIRIQYAVHGGQCRERVYPIEKERYYFIWERAITKECGIYGRRIFVPKPQNPPRLAGCIPGDNPGMYYFMGPIKESFQKEMQHEPAHSAYNGLSYDYGTCSPYLRKYGFPIYCIRMHYKNVIIDHIGVKNRQEITSGTYKMKGYDYKQAINLQGIQDIDDDKFEITINYLVDDCTCLQRIYQMHNNKIRSYFDQRDPWILSVGTVTTKNVECPQTQKVLWTDTTPRYVQTGRLYPSPASPRPAGSQPKALPEAQPKALPKAQPKVQPGAPPAPQIKVNWPNIVKTFPGRKIWSRDEIMGELRRRGYIE